MGLFSKKSSSSRTNSISSDRLGKIGRKGSQTSVASNSMMSPSSSRASQGNAQGLPTIPSLDMPPPPDPALDPSGYLRSIQAVRERSKFVFDNALKNRLTNFNVDMAKFGDVAEYVVSIIKVMRAPVPESTSFTDYHTDGRSQRDYAPDYSSIPPHGRWQHFEVGGRPRIDHMLESWPLSVDNTERTRRLIDLFLVSVLLDAGAGTKWSYKSPINNRIYRRSEGLAVASYEMFRAGLFSSNKAQKDQVDGKMDIAGAMSNMLTSTR